MRPFSLLLLIVAMFVAAAGCQSQRGGSAFSGRVRDRDTGEATAGATVTMTRELYDDAANTYRPAGPSLDLTSDADGRFRFTLPREQAANPNLLVGFELRHPRYADQMGGEEPISTIRAALARGEQPWFADLKMTVGEEITGVIEGPDGRPIAGCIVDYSPRGERYANGRTKTDASGRFRFLVARGSTRNVAIVRPEQYATQTFEMFGRRGDVGALRAPDGTIVTGIVRDEHGEPLVNTLVGTRAIGLFGWMTESWVRTDANGRYTLGPLMPGPHRLTVADTRFAPLGVYLQLDRARETVDLRPPALVTLRLKVVDEAGRPIQPAGPYPRFSANVVGYFNGQWYNAGKGAIDGDGVVTLRVPRGLTGASVHFLLGAGRAVRWSDPVTGGIASGRRMKLGTLTANVPEVVLTEVPEARVAVGN
jgi:hypothetical protein